MNEPSRLDHKFEPGPFGVCLRCGNEFYTGYGGRPVQHLPGRKSPHGERKNNITRKELS